MQRKDQQSARDSYSEIVSESSKSFLIDVRSRQEWSEEGVADFSSAPEKLVLCEWRKYPSMELNGNFFNELSEKLDLNETDFLYFLCAAGIRSKEASDYTRDKLKKLDFDIYCINVFDGFNGSPNSFFTLGKASGWKHSGLPCCKFVQSTHKTY